jgi:hypothetical protein
LEFHLKLTTFERTNRFKFQCLYKLKFYRISIYKLIEMRHFIALRQDFMQSFLVYTPMIVDYGFLRP